MVASERPLRYLLIPGSDGRSSTWSRVAGLLRDHGGLVAALDGWGGPGLMAQAEAVAGILGDRAVTTLVTWSYCGLVGAVAATRWHPDGLLVHIDPLLPGFVHPSGELSTCVPPVVLRLIGDDVAATTTPLIPTCRSVVVACTQRPDKPAFAAVERSVAVAVHTGLDVRWFESGHRPMREKPDELADLLRELTSADDEVRTGP